MATHCGGKIAQAAKGSISYELGLVPGDMVVSVNGRCLRDEMDFRFYTAESEIVLEVLRKNGDREIFEIEKDEDEHLGLSFSNPLFDDIRICKNNCLFCFVRQIPKTMRRGLQVRDDDYRMSFLYGNFITLTNMDEEDFARLEEQRLSPLRVSVHSTDPSLRERIMRNPRARDIMKDLKRLCDIGIRLHIQIVVMREVNDGKALEKTLSDLDSLGENIKSVGVVPAVYTKYRKVLPSPPLDEKWALSTLDIIQDYAWKALKKRGYHWVYGADELYVLGKREFPPYEYYDEFPQYENGIGIIPEFRHSLEQLKKHCSRITDSTDSKILVVTGRMAEKEIENAIETLNLQESFRILPVDNRFFGHTVSAAGLLTGQDIIAAVLDKKKENKEKLGSVLIPSVAVFGGKFLDDITPEDIEVKCKIPVQVVEPNPEEFLKAIKTARTKV
jgi:putative radical SAM enzyme (TIGR03279 family)